MDGLRAASILLVLAAHMLPIGPKSHNMNEAVGIIGMGIFFSLSGFLITQNLLDGQTIDTFFIRRAARILPLAYTYLIFVFIFFDHDLRAFIGSLFFIENYTWDWFVNGHFWSLCVEVHFYLFIGLSVLIFGAKAIYALPILTVFITCIRIYCSDYVDIQTHLRVDEIGAGGCVAIAYHHGWLQKKFNQFWLIIPLILFVASSFEFSHQLQYFRPYFASSLMAMSVMLIPGRLLSILESKQAAYIAKISYALYVIHPLTVHGVMNTGDVVQKYAFKRPISFVLTFILAHVSTFYYEKKFIDLAKRATPSKKPLAYA